MAGWRGTHIRHHSEHQRRFILTLEYDGVDGFSEPFLLLLGEWSSDRERAEDSRESKDQVAAEVHVESVAPFCPLHVEGVEHGQWAKYDKPDEIVVESHVDESVGLAAVRADGRSGPCQESWNKKKGLN